MKCNVCEREKAKKAIAFIFQLVCSLIVCIWVLCKFTQPLNMVFVQSPVFFLRKLELSFVQFSKLAVPLILIHFCI